MAERVEQMMKLKSSQHSFLTVPAAEGTEFFLGAPTGLAHTSCVACTRTVVSYIGCANAKTSQHTSALPRHTVVALNQYPPGRRFRPDSHAPPRPREL